MLATSLAICSCGRDSNKDVDDYMMKSPHLVQSYLIAKDFEPQSHDSIDAANNYAIRITFRGEEISVLFTNNKTRFYHFANLFKDTAYKGTLLPNANKALSERLTYIKITCDKDYDKQHKVGTSLGDIVCFCATSPYQFIQNGYKEQQVKHGKYPDYWRFMPMNQCKGYEPIEMLVSNFDSNRSIMLYPIVYLYFKKRPEQGGEYIFTITVNFNKAEITKKIRHLF